MVPKLLVLALEFHQAPLRFGHLIDPSKGLPDSFSTLLSEAGAALAPGNIQQTAVVLGAQPEELREAFLFFVRQTLLSPQADHYRVLGLQRQCTAEAVKRHHSLLVRMFHPDRMPGDEERSIALTARINAAYQTLRDPQARRRYDSSLPRTSVSGRARDDERAFFRPRDPVTPLFAGSRRLPALSIGGRSAWLWTLAALAMVAILLIAVREPPQPSLRVNPELAQHTPAGPSFLQGGEPDSISDRPVHRAVAHRPPAADPATVSAADTQPRSTRPAEVARNEQAGLVRQVEAPMEHAPLDAPDDNGARRNPPLVPPSDVSESAGANNAPVPHPPDQHTTRSTSAAPLAARSAAAARESPAVPKRVGAPTSAEMKPATESSAEVAPAAARPARQLATTRKDPAPAREKRPTEEHERRAETASKPVQPRSDQQTAGAAALVGRLERSYASGDLSGLISLFTANAVVNNGVGSAAIRRAYSDALSGSGKRRLSISNLRWRTGQGEKLVGTGAIRLGSKPGAFSGWRYTTGTIELELVPWMGEYKIARMIHRISQ